MNMADVYKELENYNQIDGLIRSIFTRHFDFNEYGSALADQRLLAKIIDRAGFKCKEAFVHYNSIDIICKTMPGIISSWNIPIDDIIAIENKNKGLLDAWSMVNQTFYQAMCCNPFTVDNVVSIIKFSVDSLYNQNSNIGRSLNKFLY
jgi:hypothetical protein